MSSKFYSPHFSGTRGDKYAAGLLFIDKANRPKLLEPDGADAEPRKVNGFATTLHEDAQGKHMPGHRNYIEGRSIFAGTMQDAQSLIDEYAGTGEWHGNKETIDFGKPIGQCFVRELGEYVETTRGTIHYSKNGAHIVPAKPKKKGE